MFYEILSLAVASQCRGCGLGGELLEHALHSIMESSAAFMRVLLYLRQSNDAALSLYSKAGFVCCDQPLQGFYKSDDVHRFATNVTKGQHGLGTELAISGGNCVISGFREMPDGGLNPAQAASPRLRVGDRIVRINDQECCTAGDLCAAVSASGAQVELTIERVQGNAREDGWCMYLDSHLNKCC